MKKYDKAAKCIKCGYGGIEDEYFHETLNGLYVKPEDAPKSAKTPEHIARTCKNCGYSWDEKPLDKPLFDAEYKRCWPTKKEAQEWMDSIADNVAPAIGIPAEMLKSHLSDDPGGIKATCEMAKANIINTVSKDELDEISNRIKPHNPVFEVRDVVTHNDSACIKTECKVAYITVDGEKACLENKDGCQDCLQPIESLPLIRKGPKVITLEKVQGTGIAIYAGGVQTGFIEIDGEKGYTITATEEDAP